ncbi:MAG: PAS domain-containing protein [Methylibium sp.]|uniref:PAS domain-containing protein n=1 Tax=Methylibium sp. TaxID=2067992 RepID=UPI0017B643BF|nr:PAS domain-containing protein [Methylibium sp.]MBA3598892.1 PAS domain-containing protein [Methylibium sp.]
MGPIESWPVSLCLASNFPINIIWGPEAIQIYNTGYRVVCGAAHSRAPRDGFIDLSYHPFRESSGEISGILGTVVDVTEQVRARKTIEDVVSQLTEERELHERFVTTLTHDLRGPFSVILTGGVLAAARGCKATRWAARRSSFAFRSKEALRLERQACRANQLGVRGLVGLARRAGALLHGRSFARAPLDCGPPGKRPQSAPCGSRGRLV